MHPMLCKSTFMRRCEHEAFIISKRPVFSRGSSNFAGLYFAVVALGAINASPNETSLLDHYCTYSPDPRKSGTGARYSALELASYYFGIAKQALGDLFESSSLESAQALLLMNALRPHSCFMYSGMAVRTAIAIGLASGMSSISLSLRKEGRRTWWCIYSHEIEMCCSSGRLDSMKELHYYQVALPTLKKDTSDQDPDAEDNYVAMIPVMVALAQIMSEASHLLYHSTKRSMTEMSQIAMSLDQKLWAWKANIPAFLAPDVAALNDPEWAFKQKLALRLRFYGTRNLIHRPFLVTSTSSTDSSPEFLQHVHICLDAARSGIQMQHESFMHRIYIRTWWYNTTYALYSAMILLHLVLSNFPGIPDEEILQDVDKSLEIFESMDNIIVARRCAEMIRGVLEVARTCLARRPGPGPSFPAFNTAQAQTHLEPGLQSNVGGGGVDEDFFSSLFSQDSHGQPDTRAEILANLVDPGILEDFAFGGGGEDFSFFLS
ncbi:hypothetical protein MW887_002655 [Aspergillus wentii]|nr:hypothetical protein MW887_002655 [Aspergillus wentii]